jgi:hypothetical protein
MPPSTAPTTRAEDTLSRTWSRALSRTWSRIVSRATSRARSSSTSVACRASAVTLRITSTALCAAAVLFGPSVAGAAVFTVTNAHDGGAGSLREAVLAANAAPGADEIRFDVPGGAFIVLSSALPAITSPVVIDGYTQQGAAVNLLEHGSNAVIRVELTGAPGMTGLDIASSQVTIRGLAIGGFSTGIRIAGPVSGTRIEGNFIGLATDGTTPRPNGIGVDVAADGGAPSDTRIGTLWGTAYRNVVSGNTTAGIRVAAQSTDTAILGNRIGTTAAGTSSRANLNGIIVDGPGPVGGGAVGSWTGDSANVISGNILAGIAMVSGSGYRIEANHIGTTSQGAPLGNGGDGIRIGDTAQSMSADANHVINNVIAHNGGHGIRVSAGTRNRLQVNTIHDNAGLGIDLGDAGPTYNDIGDVDTGPNGLQNHPVLTAAYPGVVGLTFTGAPLTQFRLEYFASQTCDASGYGEGERFIAFSYVSTDAQGVYASNTGTSLPAGFTGLTVTATDPDGNTSEFSPCHVITETTAVLSGRATLDGQPLPGVEIRLSGARTGKTTTAADGTYAFVLPVNNSYMVVPVLAGYRFSPNGISTGLISVGATVDFTATRVHTITGRVVDLNGKGVPDVLVQLKGLPPKEALTDEDGRYTFSDLTPGLSFEVTAARAGFTIEPATRTFPTLQADPAPSDTGFQVTFGDFRLYFAEGATSTFFDTRLALLNTTALDVFTTVDFLLSDGSVVSHSETLAPTSRATLDVKSVPGLETAEFSTVVRSTVPLMADRTMTWDGSAYGSHAETAVGAPALTWYLAEGATHSGFNLFYLLQNPTPHTASVRVRYLRPAPAPPIVIEYDIEPQSRFNIWVNQADPGLASTDVSAVIESVHTVPIIVERAMYRDTGGRLFNAGHASAGITTPRSTWFLAEGSTGAYFDLFVLVANPNDTPAPITATFLMPDGTTLAKSYVVAPNSRFNIWVDEEQFPSGSGIRPLADTAVSTTITSDGVPIIVERAMWWPGTAATWHEGHNSAGAPTSGTKWAVADGESGGASAQETYLLVANTSATPASVRVTLFFEDGTTLTRTFAVKGTSRFNVAVAAEFPDANGRRYGALIESLGAAPAQLVVERAMYSSAGGVHWAAGTVALATRIE